MELTGSQKRHLRSLGHRLDVSMTVGKAGLSEALASALKELFARQELLKIRLPAIPPAERATLAEDLARASGAVIAGAVGRTVLLYRPSEDLAPGERITVK